MNIVTCKRYEMEVTTLRHEKSTCLTRHIEVTIWLGFSLKTIEFDWVVCQNTASCGISLVGFCSTFLKCNSSK